MKTILRSRVAWFAAFAVAVMAATVLLAAVFTEETTVEDIFDRGLYEFYLSLRADSEAEIVADYEWHQVMFMPLLLPDATHTLTQNGGVLPVMDWAGFSKEFVAGLVPVERDGVTYWPVRVMEDAGTTPRRRLILNAKDEIIAELSVPKDYDSAWWVQDHYPDLYEARSTAAAADYRSYLEALFDGSRFVMEYDLIDHDNLLKLVLKQSVDAALRAEEEEEGGGMMMMGWGGGSVTNIQFVEIALADTNGTLNVTLAYPDDFTNRISLIACTNLLDPDWSLLLTTNPPTSTNAFTYVDTDATNYAVRFYHAYNADYDGDGDGVSDGEEKFLDGTDPEDPDDPPNVKGAVSYAGGQAGTIYVVAVTTAGSWSTNKAAALAEPGSYIIPKLASGTYYLKAWRDSDDDGTADTDTEAWAVYPTNLTVNGQVTNINLTLADPDTDADGLPDWWENTHLQGLAYAAVSDQDADGLSNLGEYLSGSDPEDPDTDDDGMGDLAEVANGRDPAVADSYRSLTYTEGFESLTVGQIASQNGWTAAPADRAVVQTNDVRGGSKALELLSSTQTPTVSQFFGARGQNTVWLDYWAKLDPRAVTHFTNYADIAAAPAYEPSVFSVNRRGEVWAYNGTTATWSTDTRFRITDHRYHRFTVKEDLSAKTWDLHIDGIKAFSAVPFRKYLPDLWPRLASSAVLEISNTNLGGTDVDCSGAAIMPESGELLVIENGTPRIHVYDQDGAYRRTITLTNFEDTEGICHVDGSTYAVVEERKNEITLITLTTNTSSVAKSSGQSFDVNIGDNTDNKGLEGITYDPVRNVFYAVKEKDPKKVYRIELADGIGYATELFAAPAGANDLSDVYYDPVQEHLYILSHESFKIIQTTLSGTVVSEKAVSGSQPEGITIAPDRKTLFVISEPDDMYRYGLQLASGDYKDITEFSRFTVAGPRGGGTVIDDLSVGTSQPSGLYGTLQTADTRVADGGGTDPDDAEEKLSDGTMTLGGGDLDLGYDASSTQIVGARFQALGIAKNSAIHRAYVQFTEDNGGNDKNKACQIKIEAQNADSAGTFTTTVRDITNRPRTAHQVNWYPAGWRQTGESNHRQRTADISILVRVVTTRANWASGNNMAFIFTDATDATLDRNRREAEARDDGAGATKAPVLHVEWAAPLP